ncbi:MAG TPA: J domain-containing protein [Euzebyales bacterium]
MREFVDAYAVLGVSPTADDATIKAAYRQLAARHHPDLAAVDERAAANGRMRELNIAYGLIAQPERRRQYDQVRAVHRAHGAFDDVEELWLHLLRSAGRWVGRQTGPRGGAYRAGYVVGRWLRG